VLTDIHTGEHPGFDRIVLDWSGPAPEVRASDVEDLRSGSSGEICWLTDEFFVQAVASPAYAHRADGSRSSATSRAT
jgi:hypothetical protein